MLLVCSSSAASFTPTVPLSSGSTTFAGNIAESTAATHDLISLTLAGSGQLTLSGTNSYSAGTTVSGGTLELTSASALAGLGGLVVSDGGQVVLSGGGAPQTASLAAASMVAGDGSPSLNLLGSSQWSALASGAQPVGQALPDAAGYEPSSMATLGGAPALGQVGVGSVGNLSTVPEPGTMALLLAGSLCSLGLWLKRRK